MYVIETSQMPAHHQVPNSSKSSRDGNNCDTAGSGSSPANPTTSHQAQGRFVPVAANMPDGGDVERMYPMNQPFMSWAPVGSMDGTPNQVSNIPSTPNNSSANEPNQPHQQPAFVPVYMMPANQYHAHPGHMYVQGPTHYGQHQTHHQNSYHHPSYGFGPQHNPYKPRYTTGNYTHNPLKANSFKKGGKLLIENEHKEVKINKSANNKKKASCSNSAHSTTSGSDMSAGCSASQISERKGKRQFSDDSGLSHDSSKHNTGSTNGSKKSQDNDGRSASAAATIEGGNFETKTRSSSEQANVHNNGSDWKQPEEDLVSKIISQVEFYLSDEYLSKDKYLLRQIRCKSEGYISIKLMTSFKKVKKLTRDWRTVRYSLLKSDNLIISPEGFRVKRKVVLPDALRRPRLLTSVVAIRVPTQYDSVDAVTSLFHSFGEIGLVRLLRPGKEIPSDLRNYATQVPDIGNTLCCVVDFEQSDAALKAVRELKEKFIECGMRLALLGPRVRRTLYRQDRADSDVTGSDDICQCKTEENGEIKLCEDEACCSASCKKVEGDAVVPEKKEVSRVTPEDKCDKSVNSGDSGNSSNKDEEEEADRSFDEETFQKQIKVKVQSILREPQGPPSTNQAKNGFVFPRNQTKV